MARRKNINRPLVFTEGHLFLGKHTMHCSQSTMRGGEILNETGNRLNISLSLFLATSVENFVHMADHCDVRMALLTFVVQRRTNGIVYSNRGINEIRQVPECS